MMKVEYLTKANATTEDLFDIITAQNRYVEELVTEIINLKVRLAEVTYTPAEFQNGVLKKMAKTTIRQKRAAVPIAREIKWYEDKLVLREY